MKILTHLPLERLKELTSYANCITFFMKVKVRLCQKIILFKGRGVVKVSLQDYPRLLPYSWALACGKYAIACFEKGKRRVYMHRFILGITDPKIQVDHINGDTLDNRRKNLRVCNNAQNASNRKKVLAKSGYKGVYFIGGNINPWMASITKNYRQYSLGCFPTPESAASRYNEKAMEFFGEFASLNPL